MFPLLLFSLGYGIHTLIISPAGTSLDFTVME